MAVPTSGRLAGNPCAHLGVPYIEVSVGLPGWAGWLDGLAGLRRYHELPGRRSIWRQVEVAGVPLGMFATDE